jgi:hypothetical protein
LDFLSRKNIEKQEISESWNSLEKLLQLSDFFALSKRQTRGIKTDEFTARTEWQGNLTKKLFF